MVITLHGRSTDCDRVERAASQEQEGGSCRPPGKNPLFDRLHVVQVLVTSMCIGTGQGAVRGNVLS
jgi:hypothetical protein